MIYILIPVVVLMSSEEAYSETNDFKNLDDAIPTETDPSGASMLAHKSGQEVMWHMV